MEWKVAFGDEFDAEFEELPEAVQDELLASPSARRSSW